MLINAGRKRSHKREKLKESCRYVDCVESLITRGICFPNIKFVIRFYTCITFKTNVICTKYGCTLF